MSENIIDFPKPKAQETPIVDLIEEQYSDVFVLAFMKGTECHTFISNKTTDMQLLYMADTLNQRRNK